MQLAVKEISDKYNSIAHWYDFVEGLSDSLSVKQLRRALLSHATGNVLEVAAGTGENLPYYPKDCQITATDFSGVMLALARKRAANLSSTISFALMDAETLGFPDDFFDAVVSSLSTCTFPRPVLALQEMARVCRRGGKILLLEHGRSDRDWVEHWQNRREDYFAKHLGCHWSREPLQLVREAGLNVTKARRVFFGILHQIEAEP